MTESHPVSLRLCSLLFLLALVISAVAGGPAEAVSAALADCQTQPAAVRPHLRYLSLYAIPEKDWPKERKVYALHCNSLSREVDLIQPMWLAPSGLMRIDIRDYGWTRETWEKLASVEPYFHVVIGAGTPLVSIPVVPVAPVVATEAVRPADIHPDLWKREKTSDGKVIISTDGGHRWIYESDWLKKNAGSKVEAQAAVRQEVRELKKNTVAHAPWLPTREIGDLALATNSDVPIVRADWFLFQSAVAKDRTAGYYDWLGLGKKEEDFQNLIGADIKLAKRVKREIAAAVARSGVTLNNRSMERFQTITGGYWRTHDFKTNTLRQNTLRLLDGDTEPPRGDASEQYGVLPNGLFTFWLQNAQGERQDTAPDFIAGDSMSTSPDKRVHAGLSCIRCHVEGIRPIDDWVRRVHSGPVALSHPDYEKFKRLRQLYLSDLAGHIEADQKYYASVLARLGGKEFTPAEAARGYSRVWQQFADVDLGVEDVARELATTKEKLLRALTAYAVTNQGKAEPILVSLLAKDPPPLRREHMEEAYGLFHNVLAGAR